MYKRQLLLTLRVPKQKVLKPKGIKVVAKCVITCKVRFTARTDSGPRKKGKRMKTLQRKRVLKNERKWRKLRAGRQKTFVLQLPKKARKKLKRQLRGRGRAGITITAQMRSAAGTRTVKRRIVISTYRDAKRRR